MKAPAGALLPPLRGPEADAGSKRAHLYRRIRSAILGGSLAAGTRLPSTRTLALDLGVSRTTAEDAFAQLVLEGFVERRVGDGTYVSSAIRPPRIDPRAPPPGVALSARGAAIAALPTHLDIVKVRPFRGSQPDTRAFPVRTWQRLISRRLARRATRMLDYGDSQGYRPLREAIAGYLASARGVRCTADHVIVLSSSQQALELTARLLLDPGDTVWMEDPGYPGALAALHCAGATVVPVPVDAAGLDVEAGRRAAPRARLAYVTPSHQYPLGAMLSLQRRLALLDWASRAGAVVVEDDYDSEYTYENRPTAAIQGLDDAGRVVYVGTFTKVLYPSIRLAYAIVPGGLVDAYVRARRMVDGHPPVLIQAVTADFIEEGHFGAHLRSTRTLYAERRAALIDAVRAELAGEGTLGPAGAGLHAVVHLERRSDVAVARRALALGVDVRPLSAFHHGPAPASGLVLGDAALDVRDIRDGVRTLARAVASAGSDRR
ncbi:MocR-like pyridoxine biosynthesis transcription factor PdxR [Anaeromyxobacter oryzae]|uniref:GntR family transcriptional regulator n=1 Tax=Anaeromyxobacter oryzae TaxID=2918170 RepID=A0ABM7WTY0_9BACT|nr:PLP-dependent aminotransferase family protein [Anaeromyxobacter oryzae]BDG02952.1 GntR family transcriptional regulator [Anaeromyxobacter oryzae]